MKKVFITAFLMAGFLMPRAEAQDFWWDEVDTLLYVGETQVLSADSPERIAIGKPEVLDVIKATDKDITVIGKAKGETTFTWWDKSGDHTLYIKVYQEDMEKIKKRVDRLIEEAGITTITTKALDVENKVLLLGELKSESEKEKLITALGALKEKTTDLIEIREDESSIEIDVQVLELKEGATRALGFEFSQGVDLTEASGATTAAVTGLKALFHVSDWQRSAFLYNLDLQVEEGNARILSRPRLVCRSGKEAELLVGGEVPIFTTSISSAGGAEGNEVDYKEYGIKLNIRPTVVGDETIDIELEVEVSEVETAETIGSSSAPTARAYPITKRTVSTQLSLRDGSMLTIGGLIKEKKEEDLKRFPWLADVPVLGAFFRHRSVTQGGGASARGDVELFITLTPRIIHMQDARIKKIDARGTKLVSKKEKTLRLYDQKEIPEDLREYVYGVQELILNNIQYPEILRDTGWEASLIVSISLTDVGDLKEAKITKSSGYKAFDDEALKLVQELKYPSFPSHVHLEEISIDVPVVYRVHK